MKPKKPPSKRHFTEAARTAALESRRRKRETATAKGTPEIYVVRRPTSRLEFGWEIRRFGAVVLDRSLATYPTMQEARTAGSDVLTTLLVNS